MFNIYTVEKHIKDKLAEEKKIAHIKDEARILKAKVRTEILSTKYRSRVAEFVQEMAKQPLIKLDDYNEKWHRKYSVKNSFTQRNNQMLQTYQSGGMSSTFQRDESFIGGSNLNSARNENKVNSTTRYNTA